MLPSVFFWVVAGLAGFASADDTSVRRDALSAVIASLPSCATTCLFKLIPQSTCDFTDVECLCSNEELTQQTQVCLMGSCGTMELLQTQNVTQTMCGKPIRNKSIQPLVISITGGTLATLAFVMRMCTLLQGKAGRSIGADDYMAGAALILAAPPTMTALAFQKAGLGRDIWTLDLDQIQEVLLLYYLGSVFYIASITMVKLSLVFFMLRVFPDRKFRNICYGVMGLTVAYGISFVIATSLQCWPAEYAWTRIDDDAVGTCNNVHLQAWLAAICNIVLDLVLLLLPLPSLWKLNMGMKKKVMIMSMFSLGVFVTIISCIRLHTLIKFANSVNITWDYVEAGYWSLVEMHVSIICTCLPYCRHLLVSFGANFLQSTKADSKLYGSSTGGARSRKASHAQTLDVGKSADTKDAPTRGDERDFVPLVEYPHRSWDKHTTKSTAETFASTDSV